MTDSVWRAASTERGNPTSHNAHSGEVHPLVLRAVSQHPSEHQVGRVKYCRSCGRNHLFPRYQAGPRELPAERWGPVKIGTVVVFGIGFMYAVVTIAAAIDASRVVPS